MKKSLNIKNNHQKGDNWGSRIKDLRIKNNLTMKQFGGRIGVKAPTVAGYEANLRTPSPTIIRRIFEEFGLTPNQLFGFGDVKTDNDEKD